VATLKLENVVVEEVKMEEDAFPKQSSKLDITKHLCFEPFREFLDLKDLLLSEDKAISPIAITAPFPLFTLEAVQEMRSEIFRKDVIQNTPRGQNQITTRYGDIPKTLLLLTQYGATMKY
jgi:hypothetical protein